MKRLQFLIVFLLHIAFTMFSQTYTLGEKWVNCGDDVQLQDPYYYQGETIIWSGPSKGGKANGYGVATKYRDGKLISKYEGTYKNGIREGKGSYTTADGVVKTGIFVNGQLKGKGIAKDEDGNSYEGEFINYRIHGKGTMTWGNGSSFSGYFVNETPYTGKLTSYTGDVIYIEKGELVDRIEESKTSYSPKIGQQVREYFDENWHRCKPTDAAYYRLWEVLLFDFSDWRIETGPH